MYDPKTVQKMLNMPGSTIRRYCDLYGDMLSASAARRGRKRFFDDQDIILLRKIKQLTAKRMHPDDVRAALRAIDKNPPEEGSALALLPEIHEQFESIRGRLAHHDELMESALRRLEEIEEDRKKPWWKRLLGL